jgi:hypothetical protein
MIQGNNLDFARTQLATSISSLLSVPENAHQRYKVIHDPIWGTCRFEPWESTLIDIPLFQRLTWRKEKSHFDQLEKLTAAIHAKRDNTGVLCLAANCTSILMWSHYAAQHKGMAIEFMIELTDSLHKVDYLPHPPQYTLHDIFVEKNSDIFSFFTTKYTDWKYEEEYRIVLDQGDIFYDVPGSITAIIFGMRTSQSDKALVRKVASHLRNIEFRECRRQPGAFGVMIEES